jgi:hypothetical protein
MLTHEIEVVIPEDHQLTIEIPKTIRSGPAKLILVVAPEVAEDAASSPPEGRGRLAALAAEWPRIRDRFVSFLRKSVTPGSVVCGGAVAGSLRGVRNSHGASSRRSSSPRRFPPAGSARRPSEDAFSAPAPPTPTTAAGPRRPRRPPPGDLRLPRPCQCREPSGRAPGESGRKNRPKTSWRESSQSSRGRVSVSKTSSLDSPTISIVPFTPRTDPTKASWKGTRSGARSILS